MTEFKKGDLVCWHSPVRGMLDDYGIVLSVSALRNTVIVYWQHEKEAMPHSLNSRFIALAGNDD